MTLRSSPRITRVGTRSDLTVALGPSTGRAIALIGGADGATAAELERLRPLMANLSAWLERSGTALVDGGTDSGVMRLMGEARAALDPEATFRLIGVAPENALRRSTRDGNTVTIARHHPEVVLVPGSSFEAASSWLFDVADCLAGGRAMTIVINGGRITVRDARDRLTAGGRLVVVAGSGRAADELATDAGFAGLRRSGTMHVVPVTVDTAGFASALGPGTSTAGSGG